MAAPRKLVARLAANDVPDGGSLRVAYPPFDVLVSRRGAHVYAIEDACNHAGVSLSEGAVDGERITCPAHGYVFDVRTGELLVPRRACDPQRTFTIEREGDAVAIWDDGVLAITGIDACPLDAGSKVR